MRARTIHDVFENCVEDQCRDARARVVGCRAQSTAAIKHRREKKRRR